MGKDAKAKPELYDRLESALRSKIPKKDDKGTYDVGRSIRESPSAVRYVVTTGLRVFDDRVGGMPFGKTVELMGLPQSGKTALAIRVCVRAQLGHIYERIPLGGNLYEHRPLKKGTYNLTVVYYDNEGSLSDQQKRTVDGTLMDGLIIPCDTVDLLFTTMEKTMALVDEEETNTGKLQFIIIIIDTVASMSTTTELAGEWGKRDYPSAPRELREGFRVMTRRLQRDNVLLIGNNHVSKRLERRNGRVAFRSWDYDAPGGKAFSYYATHRVFMEALKTNYRMVKGGNPAGYSIYFFAEKNRLGPPMRSGKLALLFGETNEQAEQVLEGGLNDLFSLLETLIYSKAADVSKETGAISFKFAAFGVKVAGTPAPTLEEQDDEEAPKAPEPRLRSRRSSARHSPEGDVQAKTKNPGIKNRAEWPAFYASRQAECDALYAEANRRAIASGARPTMAELAVAVETVDDNEEEQEGEEN